MNVVIFGHQENSVVVAVKTSVTQKPALVLKQASSVRLVLYGIIC